MMFNTASARKPAIGVPGIPLKPTAYFAGKISRQDWRSGILGHDRPGGEDYTADSPLWDPTHRLDCRSFFYGGPFFASCDHGCGHRPNAHGSNSCGPDDEINELHRRVWDVNYARVRRATLVFAYVNEADCFGTMVEVGMAAACEVPAVKVYGGSAKFTWQSVCRDLGLSPGGPPAAAAGRCRPPLGARV
jgi:hypothetical protein